MINLLTAELLDVNSLSRTTSPQILQQGKQDYERGLTSVMEAGEQSARVIVREQRTGQAFQVVFTLYASQVSQQCTCRQGRYWAACRHRVAAFYALREHLQRNPPQVWRSVLSAATNRQARRPTLHRGPVVFSIQEQGGGWSIVPHTISGQHFAAIDLADQAAIARTIAANNLSAEARPLRSRISQQFYPNATPAAIAATNLAVGNPYNAYGSYYQRETAAFYESVLPFLRDCLVYIGEAADPLQSQLETPHELGRFRVTLDQTADGMRLTSALQVGDQTIQLKRGEVMTLVQEPLWLLTETVLVQIDTNTQIDPLLIDYPELSIPARDQDEFLEKFLLPLAERVDLKGDMVGYEQIEGEPEPRVYLSDSLDGLLATLRFGYGPYEVAYDKKPPPTTTRRKPGELTIGRITRQAETEIARLQDMVTNYGLKRGTEPGTALLRKNTHPLDFLMREIPRMINAGFVIYGEDKLKSARVNRYAPAISWKVSSGIDWFDVQAVISFGDMNVPLKTIRQAVRRNERYVKLADGSIGELPTEWVDRYRHVLALGEEQGDGLRFSKHQITLLDQVLNDAEGTQADAEFQHRREKLRSFSSITPQVLPTSFKGELRPYQKHGYDWLHFLHAYGFGGCLADDMGTGKCVAPDTQILVNGTLQTAESLWNTYAHMAQFDGLGFWANTDQQLIINAIDEQTGQIVEAPIKHLYRQQVEERLRTVKLEDGSTIRLTFEHRLLTSNGWTNELKVGDYVCVPAKLPWEGKPVDPDLVILLAWQIAEGYEQQKRSTVTISQNDTERLDDLSERLRCLATRYQIKINNPRIAHFTNKVPILTINSRSYRQFLEAQGYEWGKLSRDKSIPACILQGDLASTRLFLRHYFEAEGCVSTGRPVIEISSASPIIIKQLSMLLRRLGIWLRVSQRQKCATNGSRIYRTYFNGSISGNALRRFAREIGFVSTRKQNLLEIAASYTNNTNSEGIPASELMSQAVAVSTLPIRHFGMHNTVYLSGSQQFSRESLQRVMNSFDRILNGQSERDYAQLKPSKWTARTLKAYADLDRNTLLNTRTQVQELFDREVFYCRIESVEEQEYTGWVYDFEVDHYHNFIANNIICHNTIQTLAFIDSLYDQEPQRAASLIVMPRSLLFNWQREAERFAPDLSLYLHADQGRIDDPQAFAQYDLVLTTYGTMLRDLELLRQYEFYYIILDESQVIKNPLAETSRAARMLRGKHRLVLTGTPIENSTLELWSQFAFLNPGMLGNLDAFRGQFVNPIERQQDEHSADVLRKMVFPFILRRTKDQVATDLPPRSEDILTSDMEPAQRKLYNKQRDYYRSLLLGLLDDEGGMNDARMKILEGLLRLRQICNHPRLVDPKFKGSSGKFELLIDTLETLRAEGHRALVFSQFVQMLSLVREALDQRGIPYAYLDGQTRNRQAVVDSFQNSEALPFFLISLKAGGVGLNLTAADYVIHIDPWWNPAVEMQATDRTHRIGQDKPVFVYRLVARDSVEEKILQLQEQKRALVEQVIGAEGGVFKSLTRDDVEVLFT